MIGEFRSRMDAILSLQILADRVILVNTTEAIQLYDSESIQLKEGSLVCREIRRLARSRVCAPPRKYLTYFEPSTVSNNNVCDHPSPRLSFIQSHI
jgi:hypothetical protein